MPQFDPMESDAKTMADERHSFNFPLFFLFKADADDRKVLTVVLVERNVEEGRGECGGGGAGKP